MYCPGCGTAAELGQGFCVQCGAKLERISSTNSVGSTVPSSSGRPIALEERGREQERLDEPRYAGFFRRTVAYAIDCVLAIVLVCGVAAIVIIGFYRKYYDTDVKTDIKYLTYLFSCLSFWIYYAGFESSRLQATLGKLAVGIKVTDLSGRRISFERATGRMLAHILSGVTFYVGYVMAAFTRKRQTLHDIIAGTLVLVVHRDRAPLVVASPRAAPHVPAGSERRSSMA
jgi:uncharacterized RDD family membrane protein YckC